VGRRRQYPWLNAGSASRAPAPSQQFSPGQILIHCGLLRLLALQLDGAIHGNASAGTTPPHPLPGNPFQARRARRAPGSPGGPTYAAPSRRNERPIAPRPARVVQQVDHSLLALSGGLVEEIHRRALYRRSRSLRWLMMFWMSATVSYGVRVIFLADRQAAFAQGAQGEKKIRFGLQAGPPDSAIWKAQKGCRRLREGDQLLRANGGSGGS
jgi:hypothetical protein